MDERTEILLGLRDPIRRFICPICSAVTVGAKNGEAWCWQGHRYPNAERPEESDGD